MNNFELNRVMKIINFLFFLFISFNFIVGQDPISLDNINLISITKNDSIKNNNEIKNKYLIFNSTGDSITIDTTLSIKKYYRFNYLRKDNLEILKFSNFGQTYNTLTYSYENSIFPEESFSSKQYAYLKSEDVKYYKVPTPLTELLFKSVMKQGQFTDVFFATNTSEQFNFSIGFKGMRSLGNYQNILSGLKMFRFTSNYNSKKDNYKFKTHYVSQNFENRENGGLTNASIINFESEDNLFTERSKLSVKFEDATSHFLSKRFFLDHEFVLLKSKKSNSLSLGHTFKYETSYYSFEQDKSSDFYGTSENSINDKTQIKTMYNKFYTSLKSNILDDLKISYLNYNYDYVTNALSSSSKGFDQNENSFSVEFKKNIFKNNLTGKVEKNLFGDRLGDLLYIKLDSEFKNLNYYLEFSSLKKHPGFYFELYDSDYNEIGWRESLEKIKINNINLSVFSHEIGNINFKLSLVDNFTFFSIKEKQPLNDDRDLKLVPGINQSKQTIKHLKIKWQKEFKFGKFALDNSLIYQKVNQTNSILNLPEFITRNTFYYSNDVFKKAMFLQTGISFKYFSKYYSNEYNPLISAFHIQTEKKIGNFPIIDLFLNARIQRTRIYLKAEHFNSKLTGNNFYSSPSYPYRDFIIRFGLVWNFFN
ncbi:MAG: putative porin [Flavobacteriaceae bacterium]|nr:putative porin [Flavobacteriaceae bacterium]